MEARMKRPLVVALVLALSATGAWADRYSDCDQSADPDRRIRGLWPPSPKLAELHEMIIEERFADLNLETLRFH